MFMHPRGWRQMTMAAAVLLLPAGEVFAQSKTMTITATEPMTTDNPYGDSSAPVYSLWCHTYGCLGRYDIARNKPIGILAEKWEAIDTTTWRFTLRKGLKRQDGGGRIAVNEILVVNSAVAAIIREGATQKLQDAIVGGKAQGMQFMDDAIWAQLQQGHVSPHEAFMKAIDKSRFKAFLPEEEAQLANSAGGAA